MCGRPTRTYVAHAVQVRRFKDGRIVASVVWAESPRSIEHRHVIVHDIVEHVLRTHVSGALQIYYVLSHRRHSVTLASLPIRCASFVRSACLCRRRHDRYIRPLFIAALITTQSRRALCRRRALSWSVGHNFRTLSSVRRIHVHLDAHMCRPLTAAAATRAHRVSVLTRLLLRPSVLATASSAAPTY